jgi:hypothetical protein
MSNLTHSIHLFARSKHSNLFGIVLKAMYDAWLRLGARGLLRPCPPRELKPNRC